MKMIAVISRDSGTKNSRMDKMANFSFDWDIINSSVKCFIISYRLASGEIQQTEIGHTIINKFIGYFKPNENILVGDKVTCDKFAGEFLVESVNPMVSPITNKTSHIETIMTVM